MSWTDERIELLQKLWLQGMSASKIANELAHGLTRNAVIGKVYRLGLSGRPKGEGEAAPARAERPAGPSGASAAPVAADPASGRGRSGSLTPESVSDGKAERSGARYAAATASTTVAAPATFVQGATALAMKAETFVAAAAAPAQNREIVIPIAQPVTILDLRDSMCRWPLGDPTQPDFRFCGVRKTPGAGPYCGCHSALAYQPQNDRRRARPHKEG